MLFGVQVDVWTPTVCSSSQSLTAPRAANRRRFVASCCRLTSETIELPSRVPVVSPLLIPITSRLRGVPLHLGHPSAHLTAVSLSGSTVTKSPLPPFPKTHDKQWWVEAPAPAHLCDHTDPSCKRFPSCRLPLT